jgi:hypothetical protein
VGRAHPGSWARQAALEAPIRFMAAAAVVGAVRALPREAPAATEESGTGPSVLEVPVGSERARPARMACPIITPMQVAAVVAAAVPPEMVQPGSLPGIHQVVQAVTAAKGAITPA